MKNRKITKETPLRTSEIIAVVVVFFAAMFLGFIINSEVFTIAEVRNVSMQKTLVEGDKIYINKLAYKRTEPDRGDIVVFLRGETIDGFFNQLKITAEDLFLRFTPDMRDNRLIKRIIGLPGDIVEIKFDGVYINYLKLEESYIVGETKRYRSEAKFTVPEGTVFVMGDNREHSHDSRMFGFVDLDSIEGRASFRYWPFDRKEKFDQTYY